MKEILYISLTGMTEALGRSQVLEYLVDLSATNKIYLLSFERSDYIENIGDIKSLTMNHGIEWRHIGYSNRYGILSSIVQILKAIRVSSVLIKNNNIKIVHARSMIPATIGLLLKKLYGVSLVFDTRGFAVDEKVDSGRIKANSLLFHALKWLDNYLYAASDHVVTLTSASKEILHDSLKVDKRKITVIPTCANKKVFRRMDDVDRATFKSRLGYSLDQKIIIHTGTVSGWYDFESEVMLVKEMMRQDESLRFLVLNRNERAFINRALDKHNFPDNKVKITSSTFDEMYKYLSIADASLFFIKPSYSKRASAPTKFAENVACLLPSFTNSDIGDMEHYLVRYKVGHIVNLDGLKGSLNEIAEKALLVLAAKDWSRLEFDSLFDTYFDKETAINSYQNIYDGLVDAAS